MHFIEFYRACAEIERAHDAFKARTFDAKVTASDVRYLTFLHLVANLHSWLTGQAASRFHRQENPGNALLMCAMQDDLRVRLLGRILRLKDPYVTPPTEAVSDVFGFEDDFEAWAYYGLNAFLLAELCERGGEKLADAGLREAVGWLARGYRIEADLAFGEMRLAVGLNPKNAERIRSIAAVMILPGQRLLDGFADDAIAALKGRVTVESLKRSARAMRDIPGLGDDLWPILKPHLERLKIPWAARLATRAALATIFRN